MSALTVEFAINIKRGLLFVTATRAEPFGLKLYKGEVKPLLITVTTDDPTGGFGVEQTIAASGIALTIGLTKNDFSGVLTSTVMTAVNSTQFAGDLIMNTVAFNSLIYPYDSYFEANITIGGELIKVQVPHKIHNSALDVSLEPTPPPDSAIGHAEADQRYVRKRGDMQFIMTDADDGTEQLITLRGGQFQISPIT